MTEAQITAGIAARSPLPTVYKVISEFRISYQKAKRCVEEAKAQQPKKVYTLEDF
jgi:sugar diacid utilization regulator